MGIRTDFHDLSHDELVRLLWLTFDGDEFEEVAISVLDGAAGGEAGYRLVCRRGGSLDSTRWIRTVDATSVDSLLHALERRAVPALPPQEPGRGERITELVFNRGARSVAYSWWGPTPRGYAPLAEFARGLERLAGLAG